jgi:hypothetical protein
VEDGLGLGCWELGNAVGDGLGAGPGAAVGARLVELRDDGCPLGDTVEVILFSSTVSQNGTVSQAGTVTHC